MIGASPASSRRVAEVERTGDPMKFDVERAEADFRELGDARFAGPDGEAKVADFLAGRFESMGYRVERREATGSRFPLRVVALDRLAGFWRHPHGGLRPDPAGRVSCRRSWHGSWRVVGFSWLSAVLGGRIRFGRRPAPWKPPPWRSPGPAATRSPPRRCGWSSRPPWGVPGPARGIPSRGPSRSTHGCGVRSTVFLFVLLAIRIGEYLVPARMRGLADRRLTWSDTSIRD